MSWTGQSLDESSHAFNCDGNSLRHRRAQRRAEIIAADGLAADNPDMFGQNTQRGSETKHALGVHLMKIDSLAARVGQGLELRFKDVYLAGCAAAINGINDDERVEAVHETLDERDTGDAAFAKLDAVDGDLALKQAKRFDPEAVIPS